MNTSSSQNKEKSFSQKVWTATAIVALFVIIIWILKVTFNVLLLLLAGALIAIYFRGLSGLLQKKLHFPKKVSLPFSIIFSLLLLVLFFWFAGNSIQKQASQLSETLPAAIDTFKQKLGSTNFGKKILEQITSASSNQKMSGMAQTFFTSTFGVLGDLYVVLFLGLFFTAAPSTYINGLLKLVPVKGRPEAENVINKTGLKLTKWLKGQLFAMLIVAVLTITGLLIMGVPMAFVLGLLAGILNFIPNFGPLIALVPAVLIAFLQSPSTALMVAILYIAVQVLESNIITPQIQQKMISIPPAMVIITQLFMGVLTGSLGLLLAMPILVVLMVALQELYIRKQESTIENV